MGQNLSDFVSQQKQFIFLTASTLGIFVLKQAHNFKNKEKVKENKRKVLDELKTKKIDNLEKENQDLKKKNKKNEYDLTAQLNVIGHYKTKWKKTDQHNISLEEVIKHNFQQYSNLKYNHRQLQKQYDKLSKENLEVKKRNKEAFRLLPIETEKNKKLQENLKKAKEETEQFKDLNKKIIKKHNELKQKLNNQTKNNQSNKKKKTKRKQ